MQLILEIWPLLMTLAVAAETFAPSDFLLGVSNSDPSYNYEAEERSWSGSRRKKSGEEMVRGEGTYSEAHGEEHYNGGWSPKNFEEGGIEAPHYSNEAPWAVQLAASESESRGVVSGERMRWMPTRSRYRPIKQEQTGGVESTLQEHQLRQQQRSGRPRLRPGTQLENLGGGILVDDDEEDEEDDDAVVYTPPTRKRQPQRRPSDTTPSDKPSAFSDLKSILKSSGPLSLSEILQQKNLSLEELLKGSRNALSAITSVTKEEEKPLPRRRRPNHPTLATRPLLRRRPSLPITTTTTTTTGEPSTDPPITMQASKKLEEHRIAMTTTTPSPRPPPALPADDPGQDIMEIIWQDGGDGPSLADILSSRNMTVADLIEQRQRAASVLSVGRADIRNLFAGGKEEIDQVAHKGEEGRNYARLDLMETNWKPTADDEEEEEPDDGVAGEDDQQVTQSRNRYKVVSSAVKNIKPQDIEENFTQTEKIEKEVTESFKTLSLQSSPIPEIQKPIILVPQIVETRIIHPQEPSMFENLPYTEDHRPILRKRLTTPIPREDEAITQDNFYKYKKLPSAPTFTDNEVLEYSNEDTGLMRGLPIGVKGAIIASSCLLGIAIITFLSIFAAFRYKQWRRRRGLAPYLCVAVMEAAAGGKKGKKPKIVKHEHDKDSGWGDTINSAQARLWRTLKRGKCRYYDQDADVHM